MVASILFRHLSYDHLYHDTFVCISTIFNECVCVGGDYIIQAHGELVLGQGLGVAAYLPGYGSIILRLQAYECVFFSVDVDFIPCREKRTSPDFTCA